MTQKEKLIVSAYTGVLMTDFDSFHKYASELLERPVYSHELSKTYIYEELKEKSRSDFLALCGKE